MPLTRLEMFHPFDFSTFFLLFFSFYFFSIFLGTRRADGCCRDDLDRYESSN